MKGIMSRARSRRSLATILAVVYALLLILTHDVFQTLALGYQKSIGIRTWNLVFMIAAICVGGAFLLSVLRRLRSDTGNGYLLFLAVALVGLAALVMEGLMVKYVETIHYVQYALMALLLYPIVGRAFGAVILAVVVGLVDEWYQFTILYPGRGALDINDCVMNLIGALSGGFIAALVAGASNGTDEFAVRSIGTTRAWVTGWVSACLLVVALSFTPAVGVFADGGAVTFYKNRVTEKGLPERRVRRTGAGKQWYQLRPQEGFVLIMILPLLVVGIDMRREPISSNE